MATRAQIVKNLKVLLEAVEAQKEIYLDRFCSEHKCGTLYCNAGLAATLPHFKRRGWKLNAWGEVDVRGSEIGTGMEDKDFGPDAFERLFSSFGCGTFDDMYPHHSGFNPTASHKKLAVWRLKLAIAMHEVPA